MYSNMCFGIFLFGIAVITVVVEVIYVSIEKAKVMNYCIFF